ncbi:MAG: hypothetical protein ACFB4I_23720 [Cyanophyceae cyanobacterium]
MFAIDLTLKNSPFPVSVQRKESDEAEGVYQQILEAIRSQSSEVLELTCDKQPDKKVAVLANQISAVVISQKSGATGTGRVPGFFAAAAE